MENGTTPTTVRLEIPWKTVFKVLVGILLALAGKRVWPLCELLIVSILLAIPLYRIVIWVERHNWPRWGGILLASLSLLMAVLAVFALACPLIIGQATKFEKQLPRLRQEVLGHVPNVGPLPALAQKAAKAGDSIKPQAVLEKAATAVKTTATGLLDVVLVLALIVYVMVDGRGTLQWLIAFFPREQRRRVSKGLEEIGERIVAYIIGQSIVSGLFAGYVLLLLSILRVPLALLLALLAGVLDVVPVVGISVTLVLGTVMGFTVSTTTGIIVAGGYLLYHLLENYFILPKVYGRKLKLSTLAVLVSMIAGGMLAGVLGAVAILPAVAAYPALERLWLARRLEPEVVKDHQEQLRGA